MKPKHPGGRPTDYKPEYCQKIIELGKEGYSRAELALALNICKATLLSWGETHPEFLNALNTSQDYSEAWWIGKSRENSENKNFNAAVFSINMQNRFGWNKKTEVSGSVTLKHEDVLKQLE
jgi:hypothetical protein